MLGILVGMIVDHTQSDPLMNVNHKAVSQDDHLTLFQPALLSSNREIHVICQRRTNVEGHVLVNGLRREGLQDGDERSFKTPAEKGSMPSRIWIEMALQGKQSEPYTSLNAPLISHKHERNPIW